MALLDELRTFLISQSVGASGSEADWTVHLGQSPATPNRCLIIRETGGFQDELHESNPVTKPTFQIEARGNTYDYQATRAKLEAAQTAFLAVRTGTTGLSGRTYVTIVPQSQPIGLGPDANNRPRIVQNFLALRSRTT